MYYLDLVISLLLVVFFECVRFRHLNLDSTDFRLRFTMTSKTVLKPHANQKCFKCLFISSVVSFHKKT